MARERTTASFVTLTEENQAQAMERFAVLRPYLEDGIPLVRAIATAGVPLRTAQRWLARYRRDGLAPRASSPQRCRCTSLARRPRHVDRGHGVETAAAAGRRYLPSGPWRRRGTGMARAFLQHGPHTILSSLDPAMVALALDGPTAYRDRYELIHRHRAETPNALWQADHTLLDVLVLDEGGKPARPWLTTVLDDRSRAVAGYMVFLGAPCVLNTCLALRHAIWRKADPTWPICGVPDVLYVDHGSDFTSRHLDQVAADLRFRIVYSAVARPQGRGKVERLFGTINTELLLELPGYLVGGKATSTPILSLAQLDHQIGAFIAGNYHVRIHGEIGEAPLDAWRGEGFLPRLPDSLEDLDLLLIQHAEPRLVRRDGVRFQGLRYVAPTLAGFVGEAVTVRYDPRDLSEVRLFHRTGFLCLAVCEDHAGEAVTLKDIQAARRAHRRSLRTAINERVARVADFLPCPDPPSRQVQPPRPASSPARPRLRLYEEDDP